MSDFLENSYVSKLINSGFVEVNRINLPDGTYRKGGGGYQIEVIDSENVASYAAQPIGNRSRIDGYVIITNDGIRGMWNPIRDEIKIKNGMPLGESVYKIFSNKKIDIREEKINQVIDKI